MRPGASVLTVLCAALALAMGVASPPARAATPTVARCDPATLGCRDLEALGQLTLDTFVAGGFVKRAIEARAGRATTVARRRQLAIEARRALALTRALRGVLLKERRRWASRTDVSKAERAAALQLIDAAVSAVNRNGIAYYAGVLADIDRGAPVATTAAERARGTAAQRRAGTQVAKVRRIAPLAPRAVVDIRDEGDLRRSWLRMRQNDDLLGNTMAKLIRPSVGGTRISRRGYADVLEVLRRAHLDNLDDFRRALAAASGLGSLEGCRGSATSYVDAAIARDRALASYAAAVKAGLRRRVRSLFVLQRALDRTAEGRLGPAIRCLRDGPGASAPGGGGGTILPIDDISRSRVVATSAASVQVVMRFPPNSVLEVRILWPDGTLVPGFNGPSPFPARVRVDARGMATESYGVVRSTSPTGAWRVEVSVVGGSAPTVTRTFDVTE